MASLQTPLLVALVLLAVALQATEAGPYGANVEDSVCCRAFMRVPLPWRVVKYYYMTSDSCPRTGVVLGTIRGLEICADPRVFWVEKILQKVASRGRVLP